jgi:hypothetical protein
MSRATFLVGLVFWLQAAVARANDLPSAVEAAVVIRDLRELVAAHEHDRGVLAKTRIGQVYFAQSSLAALFAELSTIVALAKPSGAAVPCDAYLVRRAGELEPYAVIEVDPDFAGRASKAGGLNWRLHAEEGGWRLDVHGRSFAARLRDESHLVISVDVESTRSEPPGLSLSSDLAAELVDADVYVLIAGDGQLGEAARRALGDPRYDMLLRGLRAFVWSYTSEPGASRQRLMIDAPVLMQVGPLVASGANGTAAAWGDEVSGLVTIDAPPPLAAAGLNVLTSQLAGGAFAFDEPLRQALQRLNGRLELVTFDSPDDWAASFGFFSPEEAAQAARALASYVARVLPPLHNPDAGAGSDAPLVLRGHPVLAGLRAQAVGTNLVLASQRGRLERLATESSPSAPVLGPLVPLVRGTTERVAVVRGYSVASSDGSWLPWATWVARSLELGLRRAAEDDPVLAGAVAPALEDLTLEVMLLGVRSMLLYDAAAALSLAGSVLTLEVSASDI